MTSIERDKIKLKRQKTSETIESLPNAWGQISHVLVEQVDKTQGDPLCECECKYTRIRFIPIDLFSKQVDETCDMQPVKQPIPRLKAFVVVGTLLSYLGERHEIVDLLQHMSKGTRNYYKSQHKRQLHTFLVDSKAPQVPKIELRDYQEPCKDCFSEEWFIRRNLIKNRVIYWC